MRFGAGRLVRHAGDLSEVSGLQRRGEQQAEAHGKRGVAQRAPGEVLYSMLEADRRSVPAFRLAIVVTFQHCSATFRQMSMKFVPWRVQR